MKHIRLARMYGPFFTLGNIYLPSGLQLTCIERPWLNNRQQVSCVPEGTYLLRRDQEGKYTGYWELQNVPNRSEIIFGHVGNTVADVEGCMAFGMSFYRDGSGIKDSSLAVKEFLDYTKRDETLSLSIYQWTPNFEFTEA